MSKSIGQHLKNPDWGMLLDQAKEFDRPFSKEELRLWQEGVIDGNQRICAVEFVAACQQAIEGRDAARMLDMLIQKVPPPPFLLPVIAHYIRAKDQGLVSGRAASITVVQQRNLRDLYQRKLTYHLIEAENDFVKRVAGEIQAAIKKPFDTTDLRKLRASKPLRNELAETLGCTEYQLLKFVTKSTPTPREWMADMAAIFGVAPKTIERYLKAD